MGSRGGYFFSAIPLLLQIEMNKASIRAVLHVSTLPAALERGYDYREKRTSATISSKTAIDRIFTDDEIVESALRDFLQSEKEVQIESSVFVFINWNTTKQVFFNQSFEQNGKVEKTVTYLFQEVIYHLKSFQNGVSPILLKVTQLQTEENVVGKVQTVDQNGFIAIQSVEKASVILSKCNKRYSQSALAISIIQGNLNFRCIYFPFSKKQLCSEIFNNFQSQKSIILNQFEGSSPSRFCIFWSIDKAFIAEVSQHLLILKSGKDDKTLLENAKKEVHRLEGTYKKLNEKHRKILGILSKCIDLENAQIDKKNLLYVDLLPLSEKPNDKLRISAIRKAENDEEIDRLQAQVALVESQIAEIKESHKVKMQEQQNFLTKCEEKKAKLWKNYQSCLNPRVKLEHTNNHNIYWRPASKPNLEGSQSYQDAHNMQSLNSITKNNIISHKNLSKKAVQLKQASNESKKGIKFSTNIQNSLIFQQQRFNKGEVIREIELKAEIKQVFELISRQQKLIQTIYEKQTPNLKGSLINLMKDRKKERVFDESIIRQCLIQDCQKSVYQQWVKQQSSHLRFQRQLRQKQLAAQTLTTIKQI